MSTAAAETVLKRVAGDRVAKGERAAALRQARRESKKRLKPEGPVSAESICKAAKRRFVDKKRKQRLAKYDAPKLRTPADKAKVLLVVRNTAKNSDGDTTQTMRDLRLKRSHVAVLVRNDKKTLKTLKDIEPYVFYGAPALPVLAALIKKKAKLRSASATTNTNTSTSDEGEEAVEAASALRPLSSNAIVEEVYGHLDILSVDDLVHNLFVASEAFDTITSTLAPFQLQPAIAADGVDASIRTGWQSKFTDDLLKKLL